MRRITLWLLSTVSALVLLFSYHTSTSSAVSTSIVAQSGTETGTASGDGPTAGGSGETGSGTTGSGETGSGTTGSGTRRRLGDDRLRQQRLLRQPRLVGGQRQLVVGREDLHR